MIVWEALEMFQSFHIIQIYGKFLELLSGLITINPIAIFYKKIAMETIL